MELNPKPSREPDVTIFLPSYDIPEISPINEYAANYLLRQQLAKNQAAAFNVEPLAHSGNHTLWVVQPVDEDRQLAGDKMVLKMYDPYVSAGDVAEVAQFTPTIDAAAHAKSVQNGGRIARNSKAIEDDALRLLEQLDVPNVPRLLDTRPLGAVSLHSFMEGSSKPAARFTRADIHAAVDFITLLQSAPFDPNNLKWSWRLPFPLQRNTFAKHLAIIRARLGIVTNEIAQYLSAPVQFEQPVPEIMLQYVQDHHVPERCKAYQAQFASRPPSGYKNFIKEDLRLCHDDLGAHNMLFTASGTLNVVDFELFAWNDPAHALSSMLCHNHMLDLPAELHEEAIAHYEKTAPVPAYIVERVRPLLKLGHIEWIARCIDSTRTPVLQRRQQANHSFNAQTYTQLQVQNIHKHLAVLATLMEA